MGAAGGGGVELKHSRRGEIQGIEGRGICMSGEGCVCVCVRLQVK